MRLGEGYLTQAVFILMNLRSFRGAGYVKYVLWPAFLGSYPGLLICSLRGS